MFNVSSFLTGIVFAIGLGISGMLDPRKVQGFLDITGTWDPSLAFVMGGALLVNFILYPLIMKVGKPVCDDCFNLPTNTKIDRHLLLGSALFGIGWGLTGLCPGPALSSLSFLNPQVYVYTFSMLFGMFLVSKFKARK